ncbi:hypothetical protein GCM10010400_27690 [Streptomyces aculeolatus]
MTGLRCQLRHSPGSAAWQARQATQRETDGRPPVRALNMVDMTVRQFIQPQSSHRVGDCTVTHRFRQPAHASDLRTRETRSYHPATQTFRGTATTHHPHNPQNTP